MKLGDLHCGKPVVRKTAAFYFRGMTTTGLVCEECKALWLNPDEPSIFDTAAELVRSDGPVGFCASCRVVTARTCSHCAIEFQKNVWFCGSEACVKSHGLQEA